MKILNFMLFVLLLVPSALLSADIFVRIASTKSKNNVMNAKARLQRLNIKILYKKDKDIYTLYSGPYKSEIAAMHDIEKMKRYFPHAATVMIGSVKEETQELDDTIHKKGFNVALSVGNNTNTPSYSGNTTVKLPNNSGLSYSLHGGYLFDNGLALNFTYSHLDTSDISVDNIFSTAAYQYNNTTHIVPFIGLIAGMSTLTWNTSPLTTETLTITGSSSSLYGFQAGIIYDGFSAVDIFADIEQIFVNHALDIDNSGEAIKHTSIQNIEFGIRYFF